MNELARDNAQRNLSTERVASLREVSLFLEKNRVFTNLEEINFACVDERYPREETAYGFIRAAGEDVGMIMAVAGAMQEKGLLTGTSANELIDRYLIAKSVSAGNKTVRLSYHSDSHKEEEYVNSGKERRNHQAKVIGCGHIGQAVGGNGVYFIPP